MFFIIENTDIASYENSLILFFFFKWFNDNLIKINSDKCHLLVSTNNTVKIKIGNFGITNSKSEKRVKLDHKLSFDDHISELYKKASGKIHVLSRVTSYMNISKRRIL